MESAADSSPDFLPQEKLSSLLNPMAPRQPIGVAVALSPAIVCVGCAAAENELPQ